MARGKTLDQKGIGAEPTWDTATQPSDKARKITLIQTFSYYNYFNSYKEAKSMLCEYLIKNNNKESASLIKKVPDQKFNKSIAWLAKMSINGFELLSDEALMIELDIKRLLEIAKLIKEQTIIDSANKPKKPNVQEIMKTKAMIIGGDLEGLLDEYIALGIPSTHTIKPISTLMLSTMLPQHVPLLILPWELQKREFEDLQSTDDENLKESYSNFGKMQVRNLIKFCSLVIHDLHSYVTYKKSTRAKPKRKPIPLTVLVSKLKYQKRFDALKLESISPVKIPESKEMFVYDTKKRKLHYYKADALSGGLTVKNNTIIGFSVSESCIKTLRKPAEQIKEFKSASKPNSRKFFKDIKAVETKTSGRFNKNIVILKIFQ
jgi:hypothetical protein